MISDIVMPCLCIHCQIIEWGKFRKASAMDSLTHFDYITLAT